MALDATVSGADSDSYVTEAEANVYHTNHLYSSDWTSATTDTKEKALKMATRILDEKIEWEGIRGTSTQALAWGRVGMVYDGYTVASDIVPVQIKNATAEFARNLISDDSTGDADGKGLSSLSVGGISLNFDKNDTAGVLPSIVQEMLRGWGEIHARAKFGTVSVVRT